jgi:hypothetical protein
MRQTDDNDFAQRPALSAPSARAQAMRKALQPFLDRLAAKDETAGVCVLGSFALSGIRPAADIFSDFDVALFIDIPVPEQLIQLEALQFQRSIQDALPCWLPNFKFVHPEPDVEGNSEAPPLQINVHQLVLQYEEQCPHLWPPDRREAFASTCDIVYDPSGRIAKLLTAKAVPPAAEIRRRVDNNLALIPVTIEHSVEKAALRGMLGDAILSMSETIDYLLDLVYALNQRDIPHRKWRVKVLSTLKLLPPKFAEKLDQLLTGSCSTQEDMINKIKLLRQLFSQVQVLALEFGYGSGDPYRELVSECRPGFQLRHRSFADETIPSATGEQYEKMKDENWNRCNFNLPNSKSESK